MTTFIYIVLIVLQLAVIFFVLRKRGKKEQAAHQQPVHAPDSFEHHRALALSVTPAQMQLAIPATELFVYGIVFDWNMADMIISLATYVNGAASLYMSNGGSISGGGTNPQVATMASVFVTSGQQFVQRTVPTAGDSLPSRGCVRFHMLTNHGTMGAQEQVVFFDGGHSHWQPLFEQANLIIAAIRNNTVSTTVH